MTDNPLTATADLIVRWSEVRAGDLVLIDDSLILVEHARVAQKPWGDGTDFAAVDVSCRRENGTLGTVERHGDRFTAVRRSEAIGRELLGEEVPGA